MRNQSMRWSGLDVDLKMLSELVEVFLKERGFNVRKSQVENGYEIGTLSSAQNELSGIISIGIIGGSDSFEVVFSARDDGRDMIKLGFLSQLIGGGHLIKKGLNRQERIEKLEREFHEYLQQTVAWLSQVSKKDKQY